MDILEFMIPGGIVLGLVGLFFFVWTIRSSQYDDMDGDAQRILFEEDDVPLKTPSAPQEKL
jgi:cbb3-type cytochrome oxidase maturation protein